MKTEKERCEVTRRHTEKNRYILNLLDKWFEENTFGGWGRDGTGYGDFQYEVHTAQPMLAQMVKRFIKANSLSAKVRTLNRAYGERVVLVNSVDDEETNSMPVGGAIK